MGFNKQQSKLNKQQAIRFFQQKRSAPNEITIKGGSDSFNHHKWGNRFLSAISVTRISACLGSPASFLGRTCCVNAAHPAIHMEDQPLASSRLLTTRQAQEIAKKLYAAERDFALPIVCRDHLWENQTTIREVEGNRTKETNPSTCFEFSIFSNRIFPRQN